MSKKMWKRPEFRIQQFSANEYIAVCWGVSCNTDVANSWEKQHGYLASNHRASQCGDVNHQYLVDLDGDNRADKMIEIDTSFGDLDCTFYSDYSFNNKIDISDLNLQNGAPIYWTTTGKILGIPVTFHHQGNISGYDEKHENRS